MPWPTRAGSVPCSLVLEGRLVSSNVPTFYESLAEQGICFVNVDPPLSCHSRKPSAVRNLARRLLTGANYQTGFMVHASDLLPGEG
jgi:hypothetical protein